MSRFEFVIIPNILNGHIWSRRLHSGSNCRPVPDSNRWIVIFIVPVGETQCFHEVPLFLGALVIQYPRTMVADYPRELLRRLQPVIFRPPVKEVTSSWYTYLRPTPKVYTMPPLLPTFQIITFALTSSKMVWRDVYIGWRLNRKVPESPGPSTWPPIYHDLT